MPERAHITSVEAIESFRANLIIYLSKARPTVEEVSADVLRTRLWLQNEQRLHWEGQVRRRTKEFEQAQQALFSTRISSVHVATDTAQQAYNKAKRALEEAEDKLKRLKQWSRDFEGRTEPMVKQLERLQTFLADDMVKAAASLAQMIKTLDDYVGLAPPSAAADPASPGGQKTPDDITPLAGQADSVLPPPAGQSAGHG
ncbi:MAG: hypothetical protein NTW03_11745 [Verrucomicrobia bacterium]|nr:hypothetical protein [Verrucomicrobiota bacterium]